jgi:hypothetical protein
MIDPLPAPLPLPGELLRAAIERRHIQATVKLDDFGWIVHVEVAMPFPLETGQRYTSTARIDMRHAENRQAVEVFLDQVEREFTAHLLTGLVERATRLGVHRAALAPYAREVVDAIQRYRPVYAAEYRWITENARPFTDADGHGDWYRGQNRA